MRISDWSSDVCSSDLSFRSTSGKYTAAIANDDRPAARWQSQLGQGSLCACQCQALPSTPGPAPLPAFRLLPPCRSDEHTSELQSLMRISYAVFCLKKKKTTPVTHAPHTQPIPSKKK